MPRFHPVMHRGCKTCSFNELRCFYTNLEGGNRKLPRAFCLTFRCGDCTIWCRHDRCFRRGGEGGKLVPGVAILSGRPGGQAELLQPVLQGPPRQAEQTRRRRDAPSLPERLLEE